MANRCPGRDDLPVALLQAALGHRRPVVALEVEGETLREPERTPGWILPLMVDVDVGLTRVPAVSTPADHFPRLDPLSDASSNAPRLESWLLSEHDTGLDE